MYNGESIPQIWEYNSAGRVSLLHGESHRFESCYSHHMEQKHKWYVQQTHNLKAVSSNLTCSTILFRRIILRDCSQFVG